MSTIEVFADVACPFTHVGLRRLVGRRAELGSPTLLRVRAWPLELVDGQPMSAAKVAEEIVALRREAAPDLFAGFDPGAFPRTSLPALGLTAEAYRMGPEPGEQVALALRDALFEHGRDIADPVVLAEIAARFGLELPRVRDDATVLADLEEGRARGVRGSPHFFVGSGGYFCPGLDIHHDDGGFVVTTDAAEFGRFVDVALRPHVV